MDVNSSFDFVVLRCRLWCDWMELSYSKQSLDFLNGSIRDDPYWISRKNGLELIKLSSINKVSLV